MKQKSLFLLTLLLTVCSRAWATDVTTTYDFSGQTANATPTIGATAHHKAANTSNVFLATDNLCKSKFAFQSVGNGAGFYYTTTNLVQYRGDRYFSIVDLKAGDRIKITFSVANAGSSTDKHFTVENAGTSSSTNLSTSANGDAITANTDMTSGTTYYVLEDGYVDFKTRKNFYLSKVEITSTVNSEEVTTPTFSITGASGVARKVTITSGESNLSNAVTTYYTTDGSNPTTSSASFTTSSQEITVGEGATEEGTVTVKAFSVSSASVESSIGSYDVTVGTNLQLNAPTFTKTAYANNKYTVTISSDQSSVVGTPAASCYYRIGTTGDFTAYSGSISVTEGETVYAYATATGYSNSDNALLPTTVMPSFEEVWSTDFTSTASVSYTETTFGTTYYVLDNANANFGVAAKENDGKNYYYIYNGALYVYYGGTRTFAIQNLEKDQYIRITSSIATTANKGVELQDGLCYGNVYIYKATDDGIGIFNTPRYNYIYKVEVLKEVYPPTITTQPVGATYEPNETAQSLTIAAMAVNGGELSYQWYSNTSSSTSGATAISGETTNSYTPSTSVIGTVYYYCTVTEEGNEDVATSDIVAITVEGVVGSLLATMQPETSPSGDTAYEDNTYTNGDYTLVSTGTLNNSARNNYPKHFKTSGTITITALPTAKIQTVKILGTSNSDSNKSSITAGTGATVASSTTELGERNSDGTLTEVVIIVDEPTAGNSVSFTLGKEARFYAEVYGEIVAEAVGTISDRSYASYVTTNKLDFGSTDDITAYIATGFNNAKTAIVLQEVNIVPAGTPVIISTTTQGATAYVSITTEDADDVKSNALVAGDGTTAWNGTDGYTYYYLASDQFHKATSGTLKSGKAYLKVLTTEVPTEGRSFGFVFEDETTGIAELNVHHSEFIINNSDTVYNLNGQRVALPTKGLYIMNGRKVVVK